MKKFLLIALLLSFCTCSFAYVSQGNWRWRKDYGPEHLDAPQSTNQNIPITITSADSVIRLRVEFYVKSPEIDNYIIANNLSYSNDSTT